MEKKKYEFPLIEVVYFEVEKGFAVSGDASGEDSIVDSESSILNGDASLL